MRVYVHAIYIKHTGACVMRVPTTLSVTGDVALQQPAVRLMFSPTSLRRTPNLVKRLTAVVMLTWGRHDAHKVVIDRSA